MATTVYNAFEEFRKAIEPTEDDRNSIIRRHTYIRESLRDKMDLDKEKPDFLSGSYIRKTLIRPINDVDIIIVLDRNAYWNTYGANPKGLLALLMQSMKGLYNSKKEGFKMQSHSIGVEYNDPPSVDVVPAFSSNKEKDVYIIPDMDMNTWGTTRPIMHSAMLSKRNDESGDMFKRLIKMLKVLKWKIKQQLGIKIKSFHLEILAYNILVKPYDSFADGIQAFMERARYEILKECYDPLDSTNLLSGYLSYEEKSKLATYFSSKYDRILKINQLVTSGKNQEAIGGWYNIFGDPFPKPVDEPPQGYETTSKGTYFPKGGTNPKFG